MSVCSFVPNARPQWVDLHKIWHLAFIIPSAWSWGLASASRFRELTLHAPAVYTLLQMIGKLHQEIRNNRAERHRRENRVPYVWGVMDWAKMGEIWTCGS